MLKCKQLIIFFFLFPVHLSHGLTLVREVVGPIKSFECNASTKTLRKGNKLIDTGSCRIQSKENGKAVISIHGKNIQLSFPANYNLRQLIEAKNKQEQSSQLIAEAAKSSSTIIILTSSGGTRSSGGNQLSAIPVDVEKYDRLLENNKYNLLIKEFSSPKLGEEFFFRGSAHFFLGNRDQAIPDLEQAAFLAGCAKKRNRAQILLNSIKLQAGHYQEVLIDIRNFKRLHTRSETAAEIYFQECVAALALNNKKRKKESIRDLKQLYPNHPLVSML
jgi:tetratricopeptide (TPR) repeat protein